MPNFKVCIAGRSLRISPSTSEAALGVPKPTVQFLVEETLKQTARELERRTGSQEHHPGLLLLGRVWGGAEQSQQGMDAETAFSPGTSQFCVHAPVRQNFGRKEIKPMQGHLGHGRGS